MFVRRNGLAPTRLFIRRLEAEEMAWRKTASSLTLICECFDRHRPQSKALSCVFVFCFSLKPMCDDKEVPLDLSSIQLLDIRPLSDLYLNFLTLDTIKRRKRLFWSRRYHAVTLHVIKMDSSGTAHHQLTGGLTH